MGEEEKSFGQVGYEAYAASTDGKTYDGRDMPTWAQVCERTPHVAKAWENAASAAAALSTPEGVVRRRRECLNFGHALAALKAGCRVARAGWNGKGIWIALTPGSLIPNELARAGAAKHAAALNTDPANAFISIAAHIDMKAADGSLVIGWLASQTDMLASDWCVVP